MHIVSLRRLNVLHTGSCNPEPGFTVNSRCALAHKKTTASVTGSGRLMSVPDSEAFG
jgi:hypothetical protein